MALWLPASQAKSSDNDLIKWKDWSANTFEQAASENRFIILDLEAVWCHWCHVMDAKTYIDPGVVALINKHFVAVKVDHDARPDLAGRYRDYGWPATIFFTADGTEIVKRQGYISPEKMKKLLRAIIDQPSPEESNRSIDQNTSNSKEFLSKTLRKELEDRHEKYHDEKLGGLLIKQKFLDRDTVEYSMKLAAQGDKKQEKRARQTLDAALALLDPAWGGFYQYSTHGDWKHPHYEKIMQVQAGYLRIYALAYEQFKEPKYLMAAEETVRYLDDFMSSPEGVYYVSQDADLIQGQHSHGYFSLNSKQRLEKGMPRIDKHIYARENGWVIEALATLYEVTHDQQYLDRALKAVHWIASNRQLPGGGFRHDQKDSAGPYLGDSLAMGGAFLQLFRVTKDRNWLDKAQKTAHFISSNFKGNNAGMVSAVANKTPVKPFPQIDENISVGRFFNFLYQQTNNQDHNQVTNYVMRYLASEQVATVRLTEAGILMLEDER